MGGVMSASSHASGRKVRITLIIAASLALTSVASTQSQPEYRTVVIFGDTQTVVSGDPVQYADFTKQVDWVIANKHTENIDFVLHVGDIIDLGTFLPVPASCAGQPRASIGFCLSQPSCDPPPDGCYPANDGRGGTDCISCSFPIESVPLQWQLFTTQWSRLEPNPATGWLGIPYAIVRGNHDNVGTDVPTEFEVPGYNQYYSGASMEALEARFAGSDRVYRHLETYPSEDKDGHAWQFRLGSRPVLVVGPSYTGGVGTSPAQIDWVIDVFGRHAALPGILLIHDMIEHSQVYHAVVKQMPTVAPSLFLAAQGHIGQDQKFIETIGASKVIRTVSDWSRTASPGGSYFAVLRFYFAPGSDDEFEAFSYSPVLDAVLPDASKTIVKQPLPVPAPEPGAGWMSIPALAGLGWLRRRSWSNAER